MKVWHPHPVRIKGSLWIVIASSAVAGASMGLALSGGSWRLWLTALGGGMTVASQLERAPSSR
ncbi:hypothetical protein GCM10027053_47930 [Intrasporangium mesophilum]